MDSAITTPETNATADTHEINRIAGMLKSRAAAVRDLRALERMYAKATDIAIAAVKVDLFDTAIAPAMSQRQIVWRVARRLMCAITARGWKPATSDVFAPKSPRISR